MSKPIDKAEMAALLMTLKELVLHVQSAIFAIENDIDGALSKESDDHWRPDPFDFKVGNFGITRIGGVDLLKPWKERKE